MKVGDLVIANPESYWYKPRRSNIGVVAQWAGSRKGENLWRVFFDGKLSHYYFSEHELQIVRKKDEN